MDISSRDVVQSGNDSPKGNAVSAIFLHVTRLCNFHCAYCYFSAETPMPDEMVTEEFTPLWEDIVVLKPEKVIFTGGEPLLRPDICDLLYGLKRADVQHHVLRCLNTNGSLVTPETARQLIGLVDEVRVSVDAMRQRNDFLRGEGSFEAAISALDCLYAVGFEPRVLITLTSVSLPDLEQLLNLLVEKRIRRISLNGFRPVGRGKGLDNWAVNPEAVQAISKRIEVRSHEENSDPRKLSVAESRSHCGVGHFLNIMPNGDIFPCHVLTDSDFRCGNVRQQRLLDVAHRGLLHRLAALDFGGLARQDARLIPLTGSYPCMGAIYDKTRSLPVWAQELDLPSTSLTGIDTSGKSESVSDASSLAVMSSGEPLTGERP